MTPTAQNPAQPSAPPLTFTVNPATDLQEVFVAGVFGTFGSYMINPWYCAAVAAAQRLQVYLETKLKLKPTLVYDWPQSTWTNSSVWAQEGMVPYFDFPPNSDGSIQGPVGNTLHVNVGGLLMESFFINNTDKFDGQCITFFQQTS